MSVEATIHFRHGLEVVDASVHPSKQFATITLREKGDSYSAAVYPSWPQIFFRDVADIETLTHALADLANKFASSQPVADDTVLIGERDADWMPVAPITTDMGGES